jgi:hypothetical protein
MISIRKSDSEHTENSIPGSSPTVLVLNDLDEKVRKMVEIIIEKPSEELSFMYYVLFICSHAYAMRQRKVLNDHEWAGWLQWMRNCFKYGTIGEHWKQIESERSPAGLAAFG